MTESSALDALTPRERQYVLELALGKSREEIAAAMGIAVKTVSVYHCTASAALGIKSARLQAYAISQGWTQ